MPTAIPLLIVLALAQSASPPAPPNGPERGGVRDAELVRMLDTYAIVRAQDALQLGEQQYAQFVTRLKRLQETRRRNQQARNKLVQRLRTLAGGARGAASSPEAVVRDALTALREHDEQAAAAIRQAYDALDEVLSVRQQAQFRVFEQMMERRKLDLLVRARERALRRR